MSIKMLTLSYIIFINSIFNVVSYVYALMWHILCLIFITPHWNVSASLVQDWVISNGPLYGVSYLKRLLFLSMTLSPLYSHGVLFHCFRWCFIYWSAPAVSSELIPNPQYVQSGESYLGQVLTLLGYNLSIYLLKRELQTLPLLRWMTTGHNWPYRCFKYHIYVLCYLELLKER